MGLLDRLPAKQLQMVAKSCGDPTAVDTTTMPQSQLDPQQAAQFIDLLVDESSLLSAVDVIRTRACSGKVHMIDLCEIVTEGACTTSCPITSIPDEYVRDWKVEKYRASLKLTSDQLECGLEGENFKDLLLNLFMKKMRMDMETAAILGDATIRTGDNQPRINNLLGVNDGWSKLLNSCVPSCQIVDAAGTAPSRFLYYEMRRRLPTRYRPMMSEYVWVVPPAAEDHWYLTWANRETPQGDAAINGVRQGNPWGTPFFVVPLAPENLPYTPEGGSEIDTFEVWFTPLNNLTMYILRDITFEFERVPAKDSFNVYVHYKVDYELKNPDMVVLAKNVSLCGQPFSDCTCDASCPSCP